MADQMDAMAATETAPGTKINRIITRSPNRTKELETQKSTAGTYSMCSPRFKPFDLNTANKIKVPINFSTIECVLNWLHLQRAKTNKITASKTLGRTSIIPLRKYLKQNRMNDSRLTDESSLLGIVLIDFHIIPKIMCKMCAEYPNWRNISICRRTKMQTVEYFTILKTLLSRGEKYPILCNTVFWDQYSEEPRTK